MGQVSRRFDGSYRGRSHGGQIDSRPAGALDHHVPHVGRRGPHQGDPPRRARLDPVPDPLRRRTASCPYPRPISSSQVRQSPAGGRWFGLAAGVLPALAARQPARAAVPVPVETARLGRPVAGRPRPTLRAGPLRRRTFAQFATAQLLAQRLQPLEHVVVVARLRHLDRLDVQPAGHQQRLDADTRSRPLARGSSATSISTLTTALAAVLGDRPGLAQRPLGQAVVEIAARIDRVVGPWIRLGPIATRAGGRAQPPKAPAPIY